MEKIISQEALDVARAKAAALADILSNSEVDGDRAYELALDVVETLGASN